MSKNELEPLEIAVCLPPFADATTLPRDLRTCIKINGAFDSGNFLLCMQCTCVMYTLHCTVHVTSGFGCYGYRRWDDPWVRKASHVFDKRWR